MSKTDLNTVDISLKLAERKKHEKRTISEYTFNLNNEMDEMIVKLRDIEKHQIG